MTPDIARQTDSCCGCGACAAICPVGSIEMVDDACGFPYPKVGNSCIECGLCDRICPSFADTAADGVQGAFWAKACDEGILMRSSSGGVFGVLALDVLRAGGVVYGAAYSRDCRTVQHIRVRDEVSLDAVMRSKYLQSTVDSSIYCRVEEDLRAERRILFTGTACQIVGLKGFLSLRNVDDKDLLCIDVICHGVPSPKLWGNYLDYLADSEGDGITSVNFRNKVTGWPNFSVSYGYTKGAVHSARYSSDWYMAAFLANASLRSSCFSCPSKRSCGSDITLGDFWGIQSVQPELDCSKGVSAVICNTPKGLDTLLAVSRSIELGDVSFDDIARGNSALVKSVSPYIHYVEFISDVAVGVPVSQMRDKWNFKLKFTQKVRNKMRALKRKASVFARR